MLSFKTIEVVIGAVLLIAFGLGIGRIRRRTSPGESFFARVFKDNRDLDSTLDRIILAVIIIFSLIVFHDDLTNIQTAGIVLALFNSLSCRLPVDCDGESRQGYSTGDVHQRTHERRTGRRWRGVSRWGRHSRCAVPIGRLATEFGVGRRLGTAVMRHRCPQPAKPLRLRPVRGKENDRKAPVGSDS